MASLVSIAIAARSSAAAALRAAERQVSALGARTSALSRSMRQQTREVSSVAGAYRDANGLWRNANGTLLTQRHTVTQVRTAYGRLTNAIQQTTRALVVYTGVQRMANALVDSDRVRNFAMSFGLLAAKAALAVAVILPLTGVIGNLIPLVMLIAPAAASAGLAMLGLKLAFGGVKEALDAGLSGDTEEFEKALAKLAPQAASTVRVMVGLRNQWRDTAKGFQGRVFEGAAGELASLSRLIKPIADTWLPRLALKMAEVRNGLANGLANFAADGRLEGVWRNLQVALSEILDTAKPLARVFGDVLEVAAPRFAQIAGYVREAAEAFSNWIRGAKDSGKLQEWLDKAMETFGKLRDIAVNVGKIIGAIFKSSGDEGDGMLDQIEGITAAIAEWANSKDGQKILDWASKLFEFLGQLAPVVLLLTGYWSALLFAGQAAWEGIVSAAKGAIMWILDGYGMLVNGAAKAFGWVPGLGDKLKAAAESFNRFRDQVNNSLNGIQKTVDITVNYRARMIGNHLVSAQQQSGTYSSGAGGRASGGPAAGLMTTGEHGIETIDFTRGMVYNSNQTKRARAETGGRGGGTAVVVNVESTPGTIGAGVLALFKSALQSNQIRLRVDASGYVSAVF